ncbi:MAG: hypothetical protein P4L84_25865 [Isosphaeraceae bacterium]|nr:hypothetical protein [Isosphaeraceae bacterium]
MEMRVDTRLTRRTVLWCPLGLLLVGCGQGPDNKPIPAGEQGLRELAAGYRDFARKNKRGPRDPRELQDLSLGRAKGKQRKTQGQGLPNALEMVQSGELIVQWGAPLLPEGDTTGAVLAYLKTVPEQGGSVLMQDGNTIKTMTADEFKTAPKAAGR